MSALNVSASGLSLAEKWKYPPRLSALAADLRIDITCRSCDHVWSERVGEMAASHHAGGQFIDLIELEYRCPKPSCGGRVAFRCEDADIHPASEVVTSLPAKARHTPARPLPRMVFGAARERQLNLFDTPGEAIPAFRSGLAPRQSGGPRLMFRP